MQPEKAKKFAHESAQVFETQRSVETPRPGAAEERQASTPAKKQSNVLPLERPKRPELVRAETGAGAEPVYEQATAEIKTRVETMLSRIKSETMEMGASGEMLDQMNGQLNGAANNEPTATSGVEASSLLGYNLKGVTAELEKRRAEIFALARNAEARAREAEERCRLAETRLEQETAQRQTAEQRLRELEDDYLRKLSAVESEELKRLEAELAREEAEALFKTADVRVKEAEARLKDERDARSLAEQILAEAEAKAEVATKALHEVQQQRTEAEAKARVAEENARAVESLMYEAEALTHAAEERYKTAEAKFQQEAEMRQALELKLKAFEEELNSYLALDWAKEDSANTDAKLAEPSLPVVASVTVDAQAAEQKVLDAEQARATAETRLRDLEAELRKAEEKHRQAEAGFKKILRKQETELRTLSEQVSRMNTPSSALSDTEIESGTGTPDFSFVEQTSLSTKIKLVSYGVLLTLLLAALVWVGFSTMQQMGL